MRNEDMLKELKGINGDIKVKHQKEKFEFDHLKGYVVKTTRPYNISETRDEYLVRITCEDTKRQCVYPNLNQKFFLDEDEADSYYNELNSLISKEYLEDIMD